MADDIRLWLEELGLDKYGDVFVENEIGVRDLPGITDSDLKELKLPLGPRRRILMEIPLIKAAPTQTNQLLDVKAPEDVTLPNKPFSISQAERRQLTVVFCDLVGSTVLSGQLDPEDLRDVMRRYQDAVASALLPYDGYIAKYLGDGILAYFGWPKAYEDQAERAVRASLDAVSAVNDLNIADGSALQARVGIATGQVVVGDLIGEMGRDSEAVTGETPNLAARLQGVAKPGQVVISENTHRLVGQSFVTEDLGFHDLKGFGDVVRIWGVKGIFRTESRFDAERRNLLSKIIGRKTELQLLLDRWQLAEGGEGQMVLISGEAGIGKSRLMQGLCDELRTTAHILIRYQCSPYHTNSALYPTIQQLEIAAGFSFDDDDATKLDKLEKLLLDADAELGPSLPLFANLLSLPFENRYEPLNLPPQQNKERLLDGLIMLLLGLSKTHPLLFLFEDTHWIDPTSQELLERIATSIHDARVLVFVTHRPEWNLPTGRHTNTTSLQLNRLGRAQGVKIVQAIAGESFSDDLAARIVERTDGVPLYIEELTKSLVEGDLDAGDANIPATLQASLLARIDRLGEGAKELTQIGAVIGREFTFKLLQSISGKTDKEITIALDRLVQSELVFRSGNSTEVKYTFKHALIQDAAYQSLLRQTRQSFHFRVADVLEKHFPEVTKAQPEILARHFTGAHLNDKAVSYWYKAGQQAIERSATMEAIAHLTAGKQLLDQLPENADRDLIELDFCLALGPALMSIKGLASTAAEEIYLRAQHLCQTIEMVSFSFQAAWGLWLIYQQRGQIDLAQSAATEVLTFAEQQPDNSDYLLQAHHAAWTTQLFVGNVTESQSHVVKGDALYDINIHGTHAFTYGGHDPGVCAKTTASEALCLLGYPDRAVKSALDGVVLARTLSHPFSLAMAQYFVAQVHQYRLEFDNVRLQALDAIALCEKHDFESFRAQSEVLLGWATAASGNSETGIDLIRKGISAWQSTGTGMRRPYFLALLADALLRAKEIDEGLIVISEAETLIEQTGENRWQSETLRLKGEMIMQVDAPIEDVEAIFQRAKKIAHTQESRWLELRAAMSLAKLWRNNKREKDAQTLLNPLFTWFSEGFNTSNLKEVKMFLKEQNQD